MALKLKKKVENIILLEDADIKKIEASYMVSPSEENYKFFG